MPSTSWHAQLHWWVNRKDPDGNDLFGGGFLGLDNIGVFDRSAPLPTGGHLEQSDGTAWMAFYALSMLQIALELSLHDPAYNPWRCGSFRTFFVDSRRHGSRGIGRQRAVG
jgi:hypothetical protein